MRNIIYLIQIVLVFCVFSGCKSRKPAYTQEIPSEQTADTQLTDLKEMLPDNQIDRTADGIRVTLSSEILFATNSSILSNDALASVSNLAAAFRKYGDNKHILIHGHTDATGTLQYNEWLSERRAQSVKTQLESQGINGSLIKITGYGSAKPIADNRTPEGRAKNRRVEIILLER